MVEEELFWRCLGRGDGNGIGKFMELSIFSSGLKGFGWFSDRNSWEVISGKILVIATFDLHWSSL